MTSKKNKEQFTELRKSDDTTITQSWVSSVYGSKVSYSCDCFAWFPEVLSESCPTTGKTQVKDIWYM